MSPLLTLDRVSMVFGGLRAVSNVSFEVPERSIFGLIGPNGAGKTTVFNCVTGVYQPSEGAVLLGQERIDGLQAWQIAHLGVARTFQNIRLFGAMTVLENVLVASHRDTKASVWDSLLRTRRFHEDEQKQRKRAVELLELFGLGDRLEEKSTSLSYGDQRRLEIVRALMLSPKLLLLDEPAAGMNSSEATVLREQIRDLRDRFALTVLLVEHNMQVVMNVCEHIHVLDRGETIAHGGPEEVRTHPRVLEAYLGKGGAAQAGAEGGEEAFHTRGEAPKDTQVLLEVKDLEVAYGGIRAVKGVSLEVRQGELVAMIGANGAGKSSTLKALAGLLEPRKGTLRFDGKDLAGLPAHERTARGMALCPEGRAIFPNLTVRENLELGAYTVRDPGVIRVGLEQAVALFPRLGERMKQAGGTLSGGEQQMLAIARALMSRPRLLMLDEPSLGIAPVLVDQIFEGIERIRASGTTILLVEQNTRRALGAAHRAYVLVTGEVVLSGTAEELEKDERVKGAYLGEGTH